jgi:hypothetical protein
MIEITNQPDPLGILGITMTMFAIVNPNANRKEGSADQLSSLDLPKADRIVLRIVISIVQGPLHDFARVFQKPCKLGRGEQVGLFRLGQLYSSARSGISCRTIDHKKGLTTLAHRRPFVHAIV